MLQLYYCHTCLKELSIESDTPIKDCYVCGLSMLTTLFNDHWNSRYVKIEGKWVSTMEECINCFICNNFKSESKSKMVDHILKDHLTITVSKFDVKIRE